MTSISDALKSLTRSVLPCIACFRLTRCPPDKPNQMVCATRPPEYPFRSLSARGLLESRPHGSRQSRLFHASDAAHAPSVANGLPPSAPTLHHQDGSPRPRLPKHRSDRGGSRPIEGLAIARNSFQLGRRWLADRWELPVGVQAQRSA